MNYFLKYFNMKHNSPITIHHRLPSSWGGNLQPNNAMRLRENLHRALHTIFQDDTPIQRLRTSLEADKTVMIPEVYKVISDVLRRFERREIEVYEPDCFNADKFLTRSKR
jgi:hypothetical protein